MPPLKLTLIIDSREQRPLVFSERVVTLRRGLPAGDYSIAGYETEIVVERKELSDYVASLIVQRPRFLRELDKLKTYAAACIAVEADYMDLLRHEYRGRIHPNAILGATAALVADYGLPVIFTSSPAGCADFTERFLLRAYRKVTESCPPSSPILPSPSSPDTSSVETIDSPS